MKQALLVPDVIQKKILLLRGQKVMLDFDLADMYGVETKALKRAVKRNLERFPDDLCFVLSVEESENLRYQFGTSRGAERVGWGGRRYPPYAFTEQGVAMLSSVLGSRKAVQVNIEIMRAFVHLREMIATHKDLARKLEKLESKYDSQFKVVFEAIRELMRPPQKPKREIGFQVKERLAPYSTRRKH